ncbi:FMN-dependent alpha-hydroxy acid dehydrogenase [Acidovorax sp. KKS102]|uniref:alpha-hydroxy acid oxidase n=1 Tax=Acidovorax sp. KKS102 TaxID=358220 RepID=UPI00028BC120|nr:alpha-hydroxy acid oxidase [Acidovorax sp. KKS102]AFU48404.1 FMN-dependent alpha-hydroxy acid dehydrogenase [Acidovorax sp. KKS102]
MLLNVGDWRAAAQRRLPRFVFDYIDGAADDGLCLKRNRADLDACILQPRVLRDTSMLDTGVELFGRRWTMPVGVAPTGLNGLIRPDGDRAIARAAAGAGIGFALSTASNTRLEEVRATAPDSAQWMQLYVMHREMAERVVRRAQTAGYEALVLTVDVPVSGNRELDLRNGFRLPFKPSARLALDIARHPGWALGMVSHGAPEFANLRPDDGEAISPALQAALLARAMDRTLAWEQLAWLRELWKGPLLLKGILHAEDARRALDHGIDGLIVSNHGGRQLDASPSAISALPSVVSAVGKSIPVLMDSGIRRGTDVAKALALGAKAVLVGRPVLYALAASGQHGVETWLRTLREDFVRTMILLGACRVDKLRPENSESSAPKGGSTA